MVSNNSMLLTQIANFASLQGSSASAYNVLALHCIVKDLHAFCAVHVNEALKPFAALTCFHCSPNSSARDRQHSMKPAHATV